MVVSLQTGLVWQFLFAIGYGLGSAVIPVLNAEVFIAGMGIAGGPASVSAAVGVSIGQTIGKAGLFLMVRYRPGHAPSRDARKEAKPTNLRSRRGRLLHRYRELSRRLLGALSDQRFGVPVTLLSSAAGIPPLYGVALVAGASRLGLLPFTFAVLTGRLVRFTALALGVGVFRS